MVMLTNVKRKVKIAAKVTTCDVSRVSKCNCSVDILFDLVCQLETKYIKVDYPDGYVVPPYELPIATATVRAANKTTPLNSRGESTFESKLFSPFNVFFVVFAGFAFV